MAAPTARRKPLVWLIVVLFSILACLILANFIIIQYCSVETRTKFHRLQFVIVLETFVLVSSRYLWLRLVQDPINSIATATSASSKYYFTAWKVTILCILTCAQLSYVVSYLLVGTDPHWFSVICYFCLGLHIHLLAVLIILEVAHFVLKRLQSASSGSYYGILLKWPQQKACITFAIASIVAIYSYINTLQPPTPKYVTIPISKLPTSLDGFKIAQLTDIHLGPTIGASKLDKVVKVVNQLSPDIVVITGDLVDSSVKNLQEAARPLSAINKNIRKYFVTGNHEYYTGDVEAWFLYLKSLGIIPLHNDNRRINTESSGNDHFCLAGTDDIQADNLRYHDHGMNLEAALKTCDPDFPVILLAHQPNAAKRALRSDHHVDLILSGHTHGGQIYPMMLGAYLINAFYAGLYQYGEHQYVYVSRGTHYFGIPMKIPNALEVTLITLKSQNNFVVNPRV